MGVQDGAGYTWAAGQAGLVRYDGLRFRRYGLEDGLPSLLVTDLAVDSNGLLWGSTARGAFFESRGQLVAFGVNELPENGAPRSSSASRQARPMAPRLPSPQRAGHPIARARPDPREEC